MRFRVGGEYDVDKLRDKGIVETYCEEGGKLLLKVRQQQRNFGDDEWQYVNKKAANSVAKKVGHEQKLSRNRWFDEESKQTVEENIALE